MTTRTDDGVIRSNLPTLFLGGGLLGGGGSDCGEGGGSNLARIFNFRKVESRADHLAKILKCLKHVYFNQISIQP